MDHVDGICCEADDDGQDRLWWYVKKCPCPEQCSKASWKKACCWSYESEEAALGTLKHHLMTSGLHAMTSEDAELVLGHANVIHEAETLADRNHYRKQVAACQAETVIDDTGDHKGVKFGKGGKVGKGKGGHIGPIGAHVRTKAPKSPTRPVKRARQSDQGRSSDQVGQLCESVAQLASMVTNTLASSSAERSSSSGRSSSTVLAETVPSVVVPIKQAQMLLESLGRAQLASTQCKLFCEAFATQFKEEGDVISKARDMLKTLIVMQNK
jgi:hypothetical protein